MRRKNNPQYFCMTERICHRIPDGSSVRFPTPAPSPGTFSQHFFPTTFPGTFSRHLLPALYGRPSMAGPTWLTIHGRPYMAGHTWPAIHGRPYMAGPTWPALHGRPYMAGPTWRARGRGPGRLLDSNAYPEGCGILDSNTCPGEAAALDPKPYNQPANQPASQPTK